jgi:hypothetical protein
MCESRRLISTLVTTARLLVARTSPMRVFVAALVTLAVVAVSPAWSRGGGHDASGKASTAPSRAVVATVLSRPIYADQLEPSPREMRDVPRDTSAEARARRLETLIVAPLQKRFCIEHGCRAAHEEIQAFVELMADAATNVGAHPQAGQSKDGRDAGAPTALDARQQARLRRMARDFVATWEFHKALQEKYGGEVIGQVLGPNAVGARRQWLEEEEANGRFKIFTPELRSAFYGAVSGYGGRRMSPEEAAEAFAHPPWLAAHGVTRDVMDFQQDIPTPSGKEGENRPHPAPTVEKRPVQTGLDDIRARCRAYGTALEDQTRGIEAYEEAYFAAGDAKAALDKCGCGPDDPGCKREERCKQAAKTSEQADAALRKADLANKAADTVTVSARQNVLDAAGTDDAAKGEAETCLRELDPLVDRRMMAVQHMIAHIRERTLALHGSTFEGYVEPAPKCGDSSTAVSYRGGNYESHRFCVPFVEQRDVGNCSAAGAGTVTRENLQKRIADTLRTLCPICRPCGSTLPVVTIPNDVVLVLPANGKPVGYCCLPPDVATSTNSTTFQLKCIMAPSCAPSLTP